MSTTKYPISSVSWCIAGVAWHWSGSRAKH